MINTTYIQSKFVDSKTKIMDYLSGKKKDADVNPEEELHEMSNCFHDMLSEYIKVSNQLSSLKEMIRNEREEFND